VERVTVVKFRVADRHALTISLIVDKLRKSRLQSSKHIDAKQNLTQMLIKQCLESVEIQ